MRLIRRFSRTAVLRCQSCGHSSLVDLGGRSGPVKLFRSVVLEEMPVQARCSSCGARNAKLLERAPAKGSLGAGLRALAAPGNAPSAGILARD